MFESSDTFLLFDYFRVPYRVVSASDGLHPTSLPERHPLRSCGRLYGRASGASLGTLWWPSFDAPHSPLKGLLPPAPHRLESIPIFGRVLPDHVCGSWLGQTGTTWTRSAPIWDARGNRVGSEWRGDDGSTFLPYDPAEVVRNYWTEGYHDVVGEGLAALLKKPATTAYYKARPILPRATQLWVRRLFSRVQARCQFPSWPIETALHDFYARLFRHIAELAGAPIPHLSVWPNGHTWAFVLTHDVETSVGYENIPVLRDVETAAGYRSSWNFVPKRYTIEDGVVEDLVTQGFEVGIHGLYHDGRDLESLSTLFERLPAMREYADRWHAAGFRSPATHRVWGWMSLLGFDYDSSYPDTDPFEPQSGGCCSFLPYFNQDTVELPITLPQDHTLFFILGHTDGDLWVEKTNYLRSQGGMTLMITHPDYIACRDLLDAYRNLLQLVNTDASAWRALPREVSAWWRRRAASRLELKTDGWRIVGPAANEGRVAYISPQ